MSEKTKPKTLCIVHVVLTVKAKLNISFGLSSCICSFPAEMHNIELTLL